MKLLYKIIIEIGFAIVFLLGVVYAVYKLFEEPEKLVMRILDG